MEPLGGILKGTCKIIDQHLLGLKVSDSSERSYRHKGEASNLRCEFDAEKMLRALVKQMQKNLRERESFGNSKENWREGYEAIQSNLSTVNTSKEILLERKIAQALKKKFTKESPWWNQMPIASGLVKKTADYRRAIDLVHRHDPDGKQYDFVELKIDSDTPLFALMEILRYGLAYLVLREKRDWLPVISHGQPVFNAEKIGLRVLAPQKYYKDYPKCNVDCGLDLSWLEKKINLALPKIISELQLDPSLKMDISSHWPTQLEKWDKKILDHPLSVLDDWKPAYPR